MSLDKKVVCVNGQQISLFIWHCWPVEVLCPDEAHLQEADGVLVVFDVNSRLSFESSTR